MCFISFARTPSRATWAQSAQAMARLAPRLEGQFATLTTGEVGVLVRPDEEQTPAQAKAELERAVTAVDRTRFAFEVESDDTGHSWLVVRKLDLVELSAAVEAVGEAMVSIGLADRVMAAVYPFRWRDAGSGRDRRIYWIYQPRLRGYTPFVPEGDPSEQQRDHELEIRMEAAVRRELPTHRDVTEWYPIWGMPI